MGLGRIFQVFFFLFFSLFLCLSFSFSGVVQNTVKEVLAYIRYDAVVTYSCSTSLHTQSLVLRRVSPFQKWQPCLLLQNSQFPILEHPCSHSQEQVRKIVFRKEMKNKINEKKKEIVCFHLKKSVWLVLKETIRKLCEGFFFLGVVPVHRTYCLP